LIVRLNQTAADGFLPLRAFKPSSSDSADRGRSIIRVTFTALLLKSFFHRLIIEQLLLPPYYWGAFYTAFVNL
jgi:hypothetical protein